MGLKRIKKLGVAIKKMSTLKQVILMPIVLFLIIWLSSIAWYEIKTFRHGHEFTYLYRQINMLKYAPNFPKRLRVMSYSENRAVVYYSSGGLFQREGMGNVVTFEKQGGEWVWTEWNTIWSNGSADDFIWPFIR